MSASLTPPSAVQLTAQLTAPAHSDIGASGMSRLIACPGSFALSQQVKRAGIAGSGSSIYAATGTVAHALAEEALTQAYDPSSQLDETVEVDGYEITVDADMIEATRVYVDEVTRRSRGATWSALETRVVLDSYWSDQERPPVSAFGTADTIIYHGMTEHMDVIDYKHGQGVYVDVIDNPQLTYYAAGALLVVPGPVTTIDLTIVQPRVRGADKVRTYRTSAVDVLMWVHDVLKPTIRDALTTGARISAGKHCRFCPARAHCPALASLAQEAARRDFEDITTGVVAVDEPELADMLNRLELVDMHASALREFGLRQASSGVAIPGWAVVPSRPVRSWGNHKPVDLERALARVMTEDRDPLVIFEPEKLRTPAALEKILLPHEWAAVEGFVVSKSSGVRLVPDAPDPLADGSAQTRHTAQDDFA